MTTRHVEVVVVGGTFAALITAALLAKRGIRGLIVDQSELGTGEMHSPLEIGLADDGSPAMELVHGELGLGIELKRRARAFEPSLQMILPDQRFDFPADRAALESEMVRVFGPAAGPPVKSRLAEIEALDREATLLLSQIGPLPAHGFFARRHATQVAKKHPRLIADLSQNGLISQSDGDLATLLFGLLPFATHLDFVEPNGLTTLRFIRPIARVLRGLHRFDAGQSPQDAILEVATRSGFELKRGAVERAEITGKGVRLTFVKDGDVVTADGMIDASSDLSGLGAIGVKRRARGLAELIQEATPQGRLHGLCFDLDRQVLPPALGDNVLLVGDPKRGERPIFLTKRATSDAWRVRLLALHPVSSAAVLAGGLAAVDEAIQVRLERLIPFVEDGRPQLRMLGGAGSERRGPGHPLFDPELDPITGLAGIPTETPYKNVFVAGPSVLPGLGVEGAYLASLEIADHVEALLGRKKASNLSERLAAKAVVTAPARRP